MNYPDNYKDFLKKHSFEDSEYIYTNRKNLITVDKVERMVKYYFRKCNKCGSELDWSKNNEDNN